MVLDINSKNKDVHKESDDLPTKVTVHTEYVLKDAIVMILKRNKVLSISGIKRALIKEFNISGHRLSLSGYLQCMADMGILGSTRVDPAIVYFINRDVNDDGL